MARYTLRFFFDAGSGVCLWGADAVTQEAFNYPIEAKHLPLPENTWRRVNYICAWYDTSIDWDYPPDPSPWPAEELARFNHAAQQLLQLLREQLGPEFEIIDESHTATPESLP